MCAGVSESVCDCAARVGESNRKSARVCGAGLALRLRLATGESSDVGARPSGRLIFEIRY